MKHELYKLNQIYQRSGLCSISVAVYVLLPQCHRNCFVLRDVQDKLK